MGCINSKNDINDVHPNIFRVVNIDEGGAALWTGQLEITEVELTLYRKGKDPTRWPLRTLRRYGFDADLFSFESGRRCPTGQGIYAFKCRRAEQLFHTLQSHIQIRNTRTDDQQNVSAEYPVPAVSNGPAVAVRSFTSQPVSRTNSQNQMLNGNRNSISSVGAVQAQGQGANQSNDSNYLDPVPGSRNSNRRFSGGIRLSSIGSGPLSPEVVSPGSPSSTNILEVTPLNPLPTPLNHGVSNLYQVTEFLHRENNNNKKFAFQHSYTNSSAIAGHTCTNTQATNTVETDSLTQSINRLTQKHRPPPLAMQTAYINIDPSSPQSSSPSEPYAMLDLDAEGCHHLYMNVGADAPSTTSITTGNHFTSGSLVMRYKPGPGIVTSSNTAPSHWPIQEIEEEMHCYENLEPGEINQFVKRQFSKPDIFCKVDLPDVCTMGPQTPLLGTLEVNYIVLDLDQSRTDALVSQSSPTQGALPPESPHKPAAGYATIDFNKTVALSNSATPCSELDSEGSRKTRHNSTIAPARHSNSISE